MLRLPLLLAILGLALPACDTSSGGSKSSEDADSTTASEDSAAEGDGLVGARGVAVAHVAFYQGPELYLAQDRAPVESDVPLVAGRDGMLRVFYTAEEDRVGDEVTARLALEGADPIELTATLEAASSEDDLTSTINFDVPGSVIQGTLSYQVSILDDGSEDNTTARYPEDGFDSHPVTGSENNIRVVVVPLAYNADGSGRTPDTSEAALQDIADGFKQLYPVADVEVVATDPVDWNLTIDPLGAGWQEVVEYIASRRYREDPGPDTFYYAMFDPETSSARFCSRGCILGLTFPNDSPASTGSETLQFAVGVGFPDFVKTTILHEIGHAHGRYHADCGYPDPSSVDRDYPHSRGQIGGRAYDLVNGVLIEDNATDIMGYCENQWISAYNYKALLERGSNVYPASVGGSSAATALPPSTGALVVLDHTGKATWRSGARPMPAEGGETVEVVLETPLGARPAQARLFRFDHLDGGWLFIPNADATATAARIELPDAPLRVTAPAGWAE